ncbi:MAG: metal-dependent hydrolase [Akkermansiaceae bacterium]|nr:metal-dependent hydrolase [Akkermansiaceae bacterium]
MDSLTQATLGAAVGELVLGKRLGNRAMLWGGAAGTLPDLDIIFSPFFDQAGWLWWHRGPSHSILVMVMASLLLARPLSRLWKKEGIGPWLAGWFVFLVWGTHVLIDCFTTYGTLVFWPFDSTRVAFNNLFIIDPLFTLPLLVGLVWAAFLRKPGQFRKRWRINASGLGVACLYVALSFGAKAMVSRAFEADLAAKNITPLRRFESPTPFNILLWRSVVDEGDHFLVGYRSLLDGSEQAVRWTVYPKGRAAAEALGESRELDLLKHFSQGWWIARPHAKGLWLGDLRFGEIREWGERKGMVDHRLSFSWDLLPAEERDKLRGLPRAKVDKGEMLRRLGKRAIGNREAWEASPRLEGVTGSLPEFLLTRP